MDIIQSFQQYLKEVLAVDTVPERWTGASSLPYYLRDSYVFYRCLLAGTQCLLMAARGEEGHTPATVQKHVKRVKDDWDGEVIYVTRAMTSYNRKRLIEQKVAFVVPGNQMYLPPVGIDLRENFRKVRTGVQKFSPSTQAVFIYALLSPRDDVYTPSSLSHLLGYTVMTMTRAFNELELDDLGTVVTEGRERRLRFQQSGAELWEKAQKYLRTPVKKRVWAECNVGGWEIPVAGQTALAQYSLLAAPPQPVHAMSTEDWKSAIQRKELVELPDAESVPGSVEIELWRYDPQLFASDHVVDRYSLYLSLRDSRDERIETALEEMMEAVPW